MDDVKRGQPNIKPGYYRPRPIPRRGPYPGNRVPNEPPKTGQNNGKRKSPNMLIIGSIALVVFIVIIILLIKIFAGNNPKEKQSLKYLDELEMSISNAVLEGNSLKVTIHVGLKSDLLDSVNFVVEGGGEQELFSDSYRTRVNSIPKKEYSFNLEILSPEDVEKVSIIPVIKDSEGFTHTGSIKDTYFLEKIVSEEENNTNSTNDDNTNLPFDSYGSGDGSLENCTSHSDFACSNGSVYWMDSCHKFEGIKESCNSTQSCFLGTCINEETQDDNPSPEPTESGCGDNLIDSGEYCDGTDLNGETCASFGFNFGILKCNLYCTYDISSCSNEEGGENPECTLTSVYHCNGGNVWWYDSCGAPVQIKESCTSEEECISDACVDSTSGGNSPPPPPPPPAAP